MLHTMLKCDRFNIKVNINNTKIRPPRAGDKWFNQALVDEGYKEEELHRLNRVRIHQQVLYLLDVLNANGRLVDLKYLEERAGTDWSAYNFPLQEPTESDFTLWKAAVYSLSPASRPSMLRVQEFQCIGYWAVMCSVPRLFQLWVCKQTMSIAATNKAQARFTEGLTSL
jgi:hypothetical protein